MERSRVVRWLPVALALGCTVAAGAAAEEARPGDAQSDLLGAADRAFEEGRLDEALQLYTKLARVAALETQGYAHYKAAWCHVNLGGDREALDEFMTAVRLSAEHPGVEPLARVAQVARRDLALPASRVVEPSRALDLFRRLASSDSEARVMTERFAEALQDQGRLQDAVVAFRALMAESPSSDRLCAWQLRVAESVRAVGARRELAPEVVRSIDLMRAFVAVDHPVEVEASCRVDVAQFALEAAMAWHREALGSQRQPGTLDRETMSQAARVYAAVLAAFVDLDQLPLEGWSPTERPTIERVRRWRAELEQRAAPPRP